MEQLKRNKKLGSRIAKETMVCNTCHERILFRRNFFSNLQLFCKHNERVNVRKKKMAEISYFLYPGIKEHQFFILV